MSFAAPRRGRAEDRGFAVYWLGQTLSAFGDALCGIAIPLLVLRATGSLAQMGLVSALWGVGSLAAGLVAGPLVDRLDRRRTMIAADLGRAAVYAAVPLAWLLAGPRIQVLYAASVLGAALGMVFGVASIAAVANLVPADRLTHANGRMQATFAVSGAVGPMLAGVLSARTGPTLAIGLNAATFLVSAALLATIRLRPSAPRPPQGSKLEEALAGARYIAGQPLFRWMTLLTGGMALVASGVSDLLVFQLKDVLGQPDQAVGIVFGISSLGAVASGLMATRMRSLLGVGPMMAGGFALQAVALFTYASSPAVAAIAIAAATYTFGQCARGVLTMSMRQELTPDHLLGRVTAAFWTAFSVPGPLGALLLTRMGEGMGAGAVFALVGGWTLFLAALTLLGPLRFRDPAAHLAAAGAGGVAPASAGD